jgi:hypothetical protein
MTEENFLNSRHLAVSVGGGAQAKEEMKRSELP